MPPAEMPGKRIELDPAAVAEEALALNDYFKTRNLVLANGISTLRRELREMEAARAAAEEELSNARGDRDVLFADLTTAQAEINRLRAEYGADEPSQSLEEMDGSEVPYGH
ncbi:hypothetical protein C5748_03795 [Phyllobacterium phragmitis]|uniref:Uncharacterized protein n=2 Tax=Phyllobacterium phragmitis TaxID=2670329 RepID=A0A2S9IXV1_9HYPH|nr:hypothetical protein C5748_03795 [Phyllobacterium phragmitis]